MQDVHGRRDGRRGGRVLYNAHGEGLDLRVVPTAVAAPKLAPAVGGGLPPWCGDVFVRGMWWIGIEISSESVRWLPCPMNFQLTRTEQPLLTGGGLLGGRRPRADCPWQTERCHHRQGDGNRLYVQPRHLVRSSLRAPAFTSVTSEVRLWLVLMRARPAVRGPEHLRHTCGKRAGSIRSGSSRGGDASTT